MNSLLISDGARAWIILLIISQLIFIKYETRPSFCAFNYLRTIFFRASVSNCSFFLNHGEHFRNFATRACTCDEHCFELHESILTPLYNICHCMISTRKSHFIMKNHYEFIGFAFCWEISMHLALPWILLDWLGFAIISHALL